MSNVIFALTVTICVAILTYSAYKMGFYDGKVVGMSDIIKHDIERMKKYD